MGLLRALVRAAFNPIDVGEEIQGALHLQKRLDLFDIECQACGGVGLVADFSNRWYACSHPAHHHGEFGWDTQSEACPGAEMVYGAKRCPECDGLGSPRL